MPALWVFQVHGIGLDANMATFEHVVSRAGEADVDADQKTIISGLDHCSMGRESEQTINGERPIGDARYDYLSVYTDWFDFWIKGRENDALQRPQAEIYIHGLNAWKQFKQWPPERESVSYYLGSAGNANTRRDSDGKLLKVRQNVPVINSYDIVRSLPSLVYQSSWDYRGNDCLHTLERLLQDWQ